MSEKQYVVFKLNNEEYGIEINSVQEIIHYRPSTPIPNVPIFIEGIINLRDRIIPIVDLKKKFDIGVGNKLHENSRIIIVGMEEKQMGLIVDDASQVLRINEENIEDKLEIIPGIDMQYVIGIVKAGEKIILLLDSQKLVFNSQD